MIWRGRRHSGQMGKHVPGPPTPLEHVGGVGATQAKPVGHPLSKEQAPTGGTLVSTQTWSMVPQWMPVQNCAVPGPMQVPLQVPPQGWPHPTVPPLQEGAVVLVVELVVVVVEDAGGSNGAHSRRADEGVSSRTPNWSLFWTSGSLVFGHITR